MMVIDSTQTDVDTIVPTQRCLVQILQMVLPNSCVIHHDLQGNPSIRMKSIGTKNASRRKAMTQRPGHFASVTQHFVVLDTAPVERVSTVTQVEYLSRRQTQRIAQLLAHESRCSCNLKADATN